MSDRIYVATRKGLFVCERRKGTDAPWAIVGTAFLGDPVTMVLPDARDGRVYAALNLGHFGVKLHRSADGGATWEECAAPAYPPDIGGNDEAPAVQLIWALEGGGLEEPGVLWAGTIPGGLFRSADGSDSWSLVSTLWERPERAQWFGGGYDHPGIHSICVDPRDARRVAVGVSCGGVWATEDGGAHWSCRA